MKADAMNAESLKEAHAFIREEIEPRPFWSTLQEEMIPKPPLQEISPLTKSQWMPGEAISI